MWKTSALPYKNKRVQYSDYSIAQVSKMDKDDYKLSIGLFADFFVKATGLEDLLLVSSFYASEHIQEGF